MVMVTMRTQTLILMGIKAGNSGKKYGVGYKVKFIVRMRYDFIKSELIYFGCEERYDNIQKRSQENASNAPSLEAPWKKWITGILNKSF